MTKNRKQLRPNELSEWELRIGKCGNLILRSADGFEFILAEIDDFDRETDLARKNKKLMEFLEKRAKQTATVSAKEARA